MSRKGEHWTLSNNIFQFGKKFGRCTRNIMVCQLMMRKHGSDWIKNVNCLIKSTREKNKSSCNRYCWRYARSWKGRVSMRKTRAEPTHKLDRFTQWSREVIASNKCVDRDGSPPQHANLTSEKALKGGENNAEK